MRKTILTLFVLLAVCACTRDQQKKLGFLNVSPDETQVETRNPLIVPPLYNQRPQ